MNLLSSVNFIGSVPIESSQTSISLVGLFAAIFWYFSSKMILPELSNRRDRALREFFQMLLCSARTALQLLWLAALEILCGAVASYRAVDLEQQKLAWYGLPLLRCKAKCIPAGPVALHRRKDLRRPFYKEREFVTLSFKTRDFDYHKNVSNMASSRIGFKVFGETVFGRQKFSFPVRCDKPTFSRWLHEFHERFGRLERESLIIHGFVTPDVKPFYARIYPPVEAQTPLARDMVDHFLPMGGEIDVDTLRNISFLSRMASVIYHIWKRDSIALALIAGENIEFFNSLYSLVGVTSVDELLAMMSFAGTSPENYGLPELVGQLPSAIAKSPVVSRTVALVTFLLAAQIGLDRKYLPLMLQKVDFSKITSASIGALLLFQVFKALWESLCTFRETGDFWASLGMPRDIKFANDAKDLIAEMKRPLSIEQEEERIKRATTLLASRDLVLDSGEVLIVKRQLSDAIQERQAYVKACAERSPPFPVFLYGGPGTGKTTMVETIISMFAEKDGIARVAGDTAYYNIHDRFPLEQCKNEDVRYLVINDVPPDYSNYRKEGMMPIEVLLQILIDSAPFAPSGASIEAKERTLNNIKYVFMSSNTDTFKVPTDPEKLVRRLAPGAHFKVFFEGGRSYDSTLGMTQGERNAITLFQPLRFSPDCVSKDRFTFMGDAVCERMGYPEAFRTIARKAELHKENCRFEKERLGSAAKRCACGIAESYHYIQQRVVKYFDHCSIGDSTDVPSARQMLLTNETPRVIDGVAIPTGPEEVLWPIFGIVFLVGADKIYRYVRSFLASYWNDVWMYAVEKSVDMCMARMWFNSRYYYFKGLFDKYDAVRSRIYDCELKLFAAKRSIVSFVRKYWHILSFAIASSLLLAFFQQTVNGAGPTFSRLQFDEASAYTSQLDKKMSYVPVQKRDWGALPTIQGLKMVQKGVGFQDLVSLCRNAMLEVNSSIGKLRIIAMAPRQILVNRHYFFNAKGEIRDLTFDYNGVSFLARLVEAKSIPECEFVVFENILFPSCPNLWEKCLSEASGSGIEAVVLFPEMQNVVTYPARFTLNGVEYPSREWDKRVEFGDCGTFVIGRNDSSAFILGAISYMKVSHLEGRGGCSLFINKESSRVVPMGGTWIDEVRVTGLPSSLTSNPSLSPNSEFMAQQVPHLFPIGSSTEASRSFRTTLQPTALFAEASEKLEKTYAIPRKTGGMVETPDGKEWKSAWTNTFAHFSLPDKSPASLKLRAMRAYKDDVLQFKRLQPGDVELHPISLTDAFLGNEQLGIQPLPRHTSAGTIWRECGYADKSDCYQWAQGKPYPVETDSEGKLVELKPEFRKAVDDLLIKARNGIATTPLTEASAKDEIREEEKLLNFKIRLFSVLDAHFNVAVRMYVMPLINILLSYPALSECYGGMNAGSQEWTRLYEHLDKFENWSDTDFKAFDASHSHSFLDLYAVFLHEFALDVGYTEEEAVITYVLTRSVCCQLFKYQNDYYLKTKGMPSGVIFTLSLNSTINSILSRMAFETLTSRPCSDYQKFVATATVGDDNLSSISSEVFDSFNVLKVAPLYKEWGYVVTTSDKREEIVSASVDRREAVFLKRKFVLWEDGLYRAPIDKDVLYRPLAYEGRSSISSVERLRNVYSSVVREAYLHGEDFFNSYVEWIDGVFEKHQYRHERLTFAELDKEFHASTFRTFAAGPREVEVLDDGYRIESDEVRAWKSLPKLPGASLPSLEETYAAALSSWDVSCDARRFVEMQEGIDRVNFHSDFGNYPLLRFVAPFFFECPGNLYGLSEEEYRHFQVQFSVRAHRAAFGVGLLSLAAARLNPDYLVYGRIHETWMRLCHHKEDQLLLELVNLLVTAIISLTWMSTGVPWLWGVINFRAIYMGTVLATGQTMLLFGTESLSTLIIGALREEIVKEILPGLGFFEFRATWRQGIVGRGLPLLMHLCLIPFPFFQRLIGHVAWNVCCYLFIHRTAVGRFIDRLDDWLHRRLGISAPVRLVMHGVGSMGMNLSRPCHTGIPPSRAGSGGPARTNNSPASLNQNTDSSSVTEQVVSNTVVADSSLPSFDSLAARFGRRPQPDAFEHFVSQPVKIHHAVWTGATPATTLVTEDLFSLWKTSSPAEIKNKYDNLFFARGTLRLTVVVQGASQMCGQMVVSAYPRPRYPTQGGRRLEIVNFPNSRTVPHVVIDPSKSGTSTLNLPMCSVGGWYRLAENNSFGSYTLVLEHFSPLRTGTENAVSISILIFCSLIEPEFQGKTIGAGPLAQEEQSWSSVAFGVEKLSTVIGGKLPFLSPFTTLVSGVSGAAGKVLRFLGFSKPVSVPEPVVLLRTVDNWTQSDGPSSAYVLGKSQGQGIGIGPEFMNGSFDEMAIDTLVAKPYFYKRFDIPIAAGAETLVANWVVTPSEVEYVFGNFKYVSPLHMMALSTRAWAGDITYTFEFVASVFHRCSVLIAYDPGHSSATPSFTQALSTLRSTTVQIVGNTSVSVVVPYSQPYPAKPTGNDASSVTSRNGRLFLFVVNPTVTNGSVDPIRVNVAAFSDNIRFFYPAPNFGKYAFNTTMAVPLSLAESIEEGELINDHVELLTLGAGPLEDWEVSTVVELGARTDLSNLPYEIFGDCVRSVKDMTSRMSLAYNAITPFPDRTNRSWLFPIHNYTKVNSPADDTQNSFVGVWSAAFVGSRGSLKFSLTPAYGSASSTTAPQIEGMYWDPGWTLYNPHWTGLSTTASPYARHKNNAMQPSCDVVFPHCSIYSYRICQNTESRHFGLGEFRVDDTSNNYLFLIGSGDDFVLGGFTGFPTVDHVGS